MPDSGRFIVIEGVDGSGKGTQIELLAAALKARGMFVFLTAEPTHHATGGLVRDALGGMTKRSPAELAGLFLADRIAHCQNPSDGIAVMLKRGAVVICDRYYYSSFAYQGSETSLDWVMRCNLECPEILKPDLCVFLDVPTDVADSRIESGRTGREIYENASSIENVRKKYLEVFGILGHTHNVKIIDAYRKPAEVVEDVLEAVLNVINNV